MSRLKYIWNFIGKNKYILTIGAFVVIIGFLDENSLIRRFKNNQEISQLKKEIGKYQAEYDESTERLNELTTNPTAMEKIARERYLMKKPNEDIFVFEN